MSNYDIVNRASDITLRVSLVFVIGQLRNAYGDDWWERGVLSNTSQQQQEAVSRAKTNKDRIDSIDFALCMALIDRNWREVFSKVLSKRCRTWAHELADIRIDTAHRGVKDYSQSDTERALDTMSRLLTQMTDATVGDTADKMRRQRETIDATLRKKKYGSEDGSRGSGAAEAPAPEKPSANKLAAVVVEDLPSWRDVMEPHQDVARGVYRKAEFAADLAQVASGDASMEYQDPVEFFSRTYVTSGMRDLLVQSLRRVGDKGGEPVIQLKTAFGGGKTHSMLALYHLLRSGGAKLPNTEGILGAAGLGSLPRVNVAVVVGTSLDPSRAQRPADLPGITVNTMWGDIAAQLARSAKKPELYKIVQEADRRHVSPGSRAFTELFDACGPCLVLLDELVAYAKKLSDKDMPAGTFDNFVTFIQEITEGAKQSKNSLVVASIPQSENEIGGANGQKALDAIEHTFGRLESVWKPVSASEGFEVVRRRLFLDCKKPELRDAVCGRFSEMYREGSGDFPVEAGELDYHRRLKACYPIHPEFFDRLYEDWTTLEDFQRTRSVLRLMASVIHELWMANDPSPMIMPGSLPLDVPAVEGELTRYLPDSWNGIIDSEVDGKNSVPYKLDASNPRYGKVFAGRRVARTIMLGSAPDVSGQSVRGIDAMRVRLGCIQPGENVAVFNDALTQLKTRSSYLYGDASGTRYWYDTRPTLRKVMEDRASQIEQEVADAELVSRVRSWRAVAPFDGIHVCPASSLDVPDDQSARLVVFAPETSYSQGSPGLREAEQAARLMLETRGEYPRKYRNALLFLAADASLVADARRAAKEYLAWRSIEADKEQLNLDAHQQRDTKDGLSAANSTLGIRLAAAYSWLISPSIDLDEDAANTTLTKERLSIGRGGPVEAAASKAESEELVIGHWSPVLLRMELDRLLWKDSESIQVGKLWEMLCTYCYLPRLANYGVLEDVIRQGSKSGEHFAVADGVADGRYLNLTLGQQRPAVNRSDYLVKPDVAAKQIERENEERAAADAGGSGAMAGGSATGGRAASGDTLSAGGSGLVGRAEPEQPTLPTSFFLSAKLDNARVIRDVKILTEEVVNQLAELGGADVELTLEVRAHAPNGITVPVQRTVSENCRTMGQMEYRFTD